MIHPKNILLVLLVAFIGCQESGIEKYRSLVTSELRSDKKVNDIFFGTSLGMTSKDFYMHCWQMNKKGLFTDGMNNMSVSYKLAENELKHPATMNFYPEFHDGKIYKMWTMFQYEGWAPWNKKLGSDSLLPEVVKLYERWYPEGNPFIVVNDKKKGTLYIKVDGNRRIIIGRYDDVDVRAEYTDLNIEEQIK